MSKKSEEPKEKEKEKAKKPDEATQKSEETGEKPSKVAEKSEETGDKPSKAAEKSEETGDKPAEAAKKPEQATEKPETAPEKPEGTHDKPAKAEKKPADAPEKPLEKMTVKELREMAKEMPGMTAVHAMKKDELVVGIKKAKGIKDEPSKKVDTSIAELKKKIKILKVERQTALEAKEKKKAKILRRRIAKLKQKTRRAAA